jgi:hypothetical protein
MNYVWRVRRWVQQLCRCAANYFKHSILSACLSNSYRGNAGMLCRAKENKQQIQRNFSFCVLWTRLTAIYRSASTLVLFPWQLHWELTIDDPFSTQERRVKIHKIRRKTHSTVFKRGSEPQEVSKSRMEKKTQYGALWFVLFTNILGGTR